MPEETSPPEKRPSLLDGLGPHFTTAVAKHVQQHEQDKTGVERRARLDALAKRLENVTNNEQEDKTQPRHVETLDSGTRVDAYLKANGSLKRTIEIMTSENNEQGGKYYLEWGPLNERVEESDKLAEFVNTRQGVGVYAALETPHSFGDTKTSDSVFVGTIIDPESIIVPEVPDPDKGQDYEAELYSVIGPDDPRFNAIMNMVDLIASNPGEPDQPIDPSLPTWR